MREHGPVREHMPGHLKNKTRIHCGGFHVALDHSSPQRSGSALRKGERSERSDTDDSRRFDSDSVSLLPPPLCRSAVKSNAPAVAGQQACVWGSSHGNHGLTQNGHVQWRQRRAAACAGRCPLPCRQRCCCLTPFAASGASGASGACGACGACGAAGRRSGVGYHPMVQRARAC